MNGYLYHHSMLRYEEMRNLAGTAEGRGGLNLADQEEFVAFAQQSDKSKYHASKAMRH